MSYYNKEKYASLNGYADDVIKICKELDLTNVIYISHSVSCMIGLLAAIAEPGLFSKIVMLGPSPCYLNDKNYKGGFDKNEIIDLLKLMDNFEKWAHLFAPKVMGDKNKPALKEELEESFCSTDPLITRQFAEVTFFFG